MNPIRSLLIFLLLTFALCNNASNLAETGLKNLNLMPDNRELETFGIAVSSVLQKAVNNFLIIRIIICGEASKVNNYQFNREINEIMRINEGKLVIDVLNFERHFNLTRIFYEKQKIDFCKGVCLLLIESGEAFKDLGRTVRAIKSTEMIFYFVRGVTADQFMELTMMEFNGLVPDAINEYTIIDTKEFYDLLEMNRFAKGGSCDVRSMATINRFSKSKMEWEKPLERLEKRMTFNGCRINIELKENQAFVTTSPIGELLYSGLFIDIMKLASEMGDCKPQYYIMPQQPDTEDSGEGINAIDQRSFESLYIYVNAILKTLSQITFVSKELYFVIPQGELYTEWEKLFLAFDKPTWLLIVITFAASFAVIIFISNFATRVVQDFVFGENVTTPSLNVLIALFGLGQIVLPGRNFARFLLTLFIIWSLIIRTCYQGLLFEYMIGEGRKPAIKSFEELLERNFTYHTYASHCFKLVDVHLSGK